MRSFFLSRLYNNSDIDIDPSLSMLITFYGKISIWLPGSQKIYENPFGMDLETINKRDQICNEPY